jgi:glycosyltransferase involved in cell wall biosynthesis
MPRGLRFSYVVAVHNEESVLEKTVDVLAHHLAQWPGSRVILGENGSTDRSAEICAKLEGPRGAIEVRSFVVKDAGLGYALERGLELALDADSEKTASARDAHWVAFTAADLPFGFSDLDEAVKAIDGGFHDGIIIGSKAHPQTHITKTWKRTVASLGYQALRVALLGMRTRDPQGTFFIHDAEARRLVGRVQARNYFYTTELVHLAERDRIAIREVPVQYAGEQRPSSVRLLKHGRQMAKQLIDLRARTR